MADSDSSNHPYHMVEPSPWPALGALSVGVVAIGALLYMHDLTVWLMVLGFLMVLYTMFVWWRDVVNEAEAGDHTSVVQLGLRYGMVLFIASEVMFFVAWFWAYYTSSLYPAIAAGGVWPPEGIETFKTFELPFVNTLILLTSGTTITWAHHALREGNRKGLILGLWFTIILGLAFTAVQAFEYSHAVFGFDEMPIYASTFFLATGFHGMHVVVGTIFLIVCLIRAYKDHFTPAQHFGFEAAAWYWHFVDVVWIFLFCSIYWWGACDNCHG